MARYIDADALKNDILMKYKFNWEVPCSSEDRIIQRVVTDMRVLIERSITADVVPKREVEKLKKENAELLISKETDVLISMEKLVKVRTGHPIFKAIEEKVAREIFEEIETVLCYSVRPKINANGTITTVKSRDLYIRDKDYAELKKKYTEEKKDEGANVPTN